MMHHYLEIKMAVPNILNDADGKLRYDRNF